VFALAEAVRRATPERMAQIAENAAWLRRELRMRGFGLVAPESVASPAIVTMVLDEGMSAAELGEELEIRGYWLNYRSNYLMERNWIQASLLGNPERASLEKLLHVLRTVCTRYSVQRSTSPNTAKK
jgi:aspartate aminotransferase-like enzyme